MEQFIGYKVLRKDPETGQLRSATSAGFVHSYEIGKKTVPLKGSTYECGPLCVFKSKHDASVWIFNHFHKRPDIVIYECRFEYLEEERTAWFKVDGMHIFKAQILPLGTALAGSVVLLREIKKGTAL